MTGNIFRGHIQDALFNMVGIWTSQGIQLLGMPTEAIHTRSCRTATFPSRTPATSSTT